MLQNILNENLKMHSFKTNYSHTISVINNNIAIWFTFRSIDFYCTLAYSNVSLSINNKHNISVYKYKEIITQ